MALQEGDFIELDFIGKTDEGIFDTTHEDLAKEEGLYREQQDYSPITIVVGEEHVVPGLDAALKGKEVGEHTIHIDTEDAFGKKSTDKLEIVPMREFKKQGIKPFVGLEVNIDQQRGTVRTVSGGRVIVDFNHPLAGKDVTYDVDIKRVVEAPVEKVEAILEIMQVPYDTINEDDDAVTVELTNQFPDEIVEDLKDEVDRLTEADVTFSMPEGEGSQDVPDMADLDVEEATDE